jgi:hypothetical protein
LFAPENGGFGCKQKCEIDETEERSGKMVLSSKVMPVCAAHRRPSVAERKKINEASQSTGVEQKLELRKVMIDEKCKSEALSIMTKLSPSKVLQG